LGLRPICRRPRSTEQREGDREKERVKERGGWLEHGDVLDQGCVPEEADNQDVDEEDYEEHNESLEAIAWGFAGCEVFKHLLSVNIFSATVPADDELV